MAQKKGKRILTLLLTIVLLMVGFAPAALAAKAQLTGNATLREEAASTAKTVVKLKKGASVDVLEDKELDGFIKVASGDKQGYVEASLLSYIMEAGYATRNTQMREGKGSNYAASISIPINALVNVIDSNDATWWKIQYENKTGYCLAVTLKLGIPPTQASPEGNSALTTNTLDPNAENIAKARGINKDTVGWITVPNTNISDPILYAPNFYYNYYNIYKKKSLDGVYPYANRLTKNVVIFGHNLRGSNSGFHQLHHLQEAGSGRSSCQYGSCGRSISSLSGWYKTQKSRTFDISIFGKTKWEVWAMYEVPRNEPIGTLRNNWNTSPANMKNWIEIQLKRSEINFDVPVSDKDQIMTIITCGTNYDSATANSRLFTFLKCVG